MAETEAPKARDEAEETTSQQAQPKSTAGVLRRFMTRRWIVTIVALSIAVHCVGFAYYQLWGKTAAGQPTPEVSLGAFTFEAPGDEDGRIAAAEFSLHIALLRQVDQPARSRLTARKHRVQQNVEELLRQAHGGDFEDPNLAGLKRQLQEQINETLGIRAIADVIITDLKLHRSPQATSPLTDTAEVAPWVEIGSEGSH